MPRPPKWKSETQAIRVPKHAVEACLELARQLDESQGSKLNVQNSQCCDLQIYRPDSSFDAIKEGLSEGYISGTAQVSGPSPQDLGPYLVSIGDERYLVQTPRDLTTEQWVAAGQLLDEVWQELAKLTEDQRWYVFSRLVQEWGQEGRMHDVA